MGDPKIEICSFSEGTCFSQNITDVSFKIRLCEPTVETPLHLCILAVVTISCILYVLAMWKLHKRSDYEVLYHESKRILRCIKARAFAHRTLLSKIINEE